MVLLFLLGGLFIFSANALPKLDDSPPVGQETAVPSVEEKRKREECIDRGGIWMSDAQMGFLPQVGCNEPTNDKGKTCYDSSECESACIDHSSGAKGGICYGYQKFFGCGKRVKIDDHVAILCID